MSGPDTPGRALLRRLKRDTEALHLTAEREVTFLGPAAAVDDYRRYLEKMLGFHGPAEGALGGHVALAALGFEAASRRKAPALVLDLAALGVDGGRAALCSDLPRTEELPAALGCAYVLEGSTLGGQYILREMAKRFPALVGRATAFVDVYGPNTGAMWRAYRGVLERAVAAGVDEDGVVRGACVTFDAIGRWLRAP